MESEARFTEPRPDCPNPSRWHSPDSDSTEIEVSRLVGAFVEALRPDLVIETGTAFGQTAELIGQSLAGHGGRLVTYEVDPGRVKFSRKRCAALPVDVVQKESLPALGLMTKNYAGKVGFAWLDSLFELRVRELRLADQLIKPGGIIGIHDCGEPGNTKYGEFSRKIAREASKLGLSRLSLPTPRGVTFLQKGFK